MRISKKNPINGFNMRNSKFKRKCANALSMRISYLLQIFTKTCANGLYKNLNNSQEIVLMALV